MAIGHCVANCLRVIDLNLYMPPRSDPDSLERDILAESFFTGEGRLFLFRRHNGRRGHVREDSPWAGMTRDQRYPAAARLVINGATFVHWYDCLTDASCALSEAPGASAVVLP